MYNPGLKGVTAVQTSLSNIDGEKGMLTYRGIEIERLVEKYSFEEVAYYLLYREFPNEEMKIRFNEDLIKYRLIPNYIVRVLDLMPKEMSLMDVLRTVISSFYMQDDNDIYDVAKRLISVFPTVIAYRYRQQNNLPEIPPNNSLDHVNNFVYMLTGRINATHAKILETYLILTMEHGLNASTFAARVTISTESDLISAITSALGTMKGPLHGGAPSGVIALLEEIKTEDAISEKIHMKLENKERIMGFGHRVYKTVDPRALALKNTIMKMDDLPDWIDLAVKTEQETIKILKQVKPDHKLYTNVEYYAAAIMKTMDLDESLFTAIFSSSRIVGWCAHTIEQINNNTLFRPNAMYIGS